MIPAENRKAVRYTLLENINVNRPNGNKDRSLFVPFIKKKIENWKVFWAVK